MAPFLARSSDKINPNVTGGSAWSSTDMPSAAQQNQAQEAQGSLVDTEFLIVGAGPAGASLACFLASHGEF
ncbi:2,4-dichlorophenol 6-monooxygenase [Tolypocladium capitatum]|uniref:2,4-dichlorophenol 6-monooxygenase n=1 Tax=Tolypocladium capitatum TaxID=45235 RepID=A0A2K3Q9I0_9HYPO|nr:2,4-dichlorophenol 6-monooxygenase [Tolypocladium capitatum]